jgi:hypothetical protein
MSSNLLTTSDFVGASCWSANGALPDLKLTTKSDAVSKSPVPANFAFSEE